MSEVIHFKMPQTTEEANAVPPHNQDAEQAVLGALLLSNARYEQVGDFLRPMHFYHPIHGEIYEAVCRFIDRGQVADAITLRDYFHNKEVLQPLGGAKYLIDLANAVVNVWDIGDYARMIYDLYLRRQLMNIGEEIIIDARKTDEWKTNGISQIGVAEKRLFDLATEGQLKGGFTHLSDAVAGAIRSAEKAFKNTGKLVGVTTGFLRLDESLGGLHPSDLLILAGRPSMGKTALATNLAFNAALAHLKDSTDGAPVAFFSLEMSAEQLAGRILAAESGVCSDRIRRGAIGNNDFEAILKSARLLDKVPLYVDDTPSLSIGAIRNRSRRLKRQSGLGLIVIDYLQLIEPTRDGRRETNRVQEISEITRSLKALAKELHVPVIALSQLSRMVEQREDKRPQLSDLRESGSIEQDADVVMFVYREEYYEIRKEPKENTPEHTAWAANLNTIANQAEVIIAKQRHGPVKTIKLFFDGNVTKFGNLDETHTSQPGPAF